VDGLEQAGGVEADPVRVVEGEEAGIERACDVDRLLPVGHDLLPR
jgi:hypothetical protein